MPTQSPAPKTPTVLGNPRGSMVGRVATPATPQPPSHAPATPIPPPAAPSLLPYTPTTPEPVAKFCTANAMFTFALFSIRVAFPHPHPTTCFFLRAEPRPQRRRRRL